MPLQKIQFTPGINRDITQYSNSGGWYDCDKIRFRKGYPETIGGWQLVEPTNVSGVTRSLHEWSLLNGSLNLGVGTNSHYYILNNDTFWDITPIDFVAGPVDGSLSAGWGIGKWGQGTWGASIQTASYGPQYVDPLIWSADNFGQDLLLNPRGGPIYRWSGSPPAGSPTTSQYTIQATKLSTYAGAADVPDNANGIFVSPISQNVVALGCTPYGQSGTPDPMQIRWSDLLNANMWTPTRTNSAGGQRLSLGSRIISNLTTFAETLIWTDVALYSMKYSGAPYVFSFQLIADGHTMIGPNAAISNGSTVFWMDKGNFSVYNGSVTELPCSVKSYVFSNLNREQGWKCFAAHSRSFSEVWWFYPSKASREIDSYVIYNYVDNLWSIGTMNRTAWIDSGRLAQPVAVDAAGYVYFHEVGIAANGNPMNAYIESADLDMQGGENFLFCNKIVPDVQFLGTGSNQTLGLDLMKRHSAGESKVIERSLQVNPTTRDLHTRIRGRRLSVKFSSQDVNTAWRLGSTELSLQVSGKR